MNKTNEEKTGLNDIDIDSNYFEQVKSYKYLGSILSWDNSNWEEIENRIAQNNKASYINKNI
jgi:hypothetical protein